MTRVQTFGAVVLAVVVAGLVGFLYGRSGGSEDRTQLAAIRLRLQLAEARVQVLDARVGLYLVNFGEATGHLAAAKNLATGARERLAADRRADLTAKLDQAVAHLDAAHEQASRLNQDANSRAGEAARLLNDVLQALPAAPLSSTPSP
jgi:hypothetical protein